MQMFKRRGELNRQELVFLLDFYDYFFTVMVESRDCLLINRSTLTEKNCLYLCLWLQWRANRFEMVVKRVKI